jgi:hypothetical protein
MGAREVTCRVLLDTHKCTSGTPQADGTATNSSSATISSTPTYAAQLWQHHPSVKLKLLGRSACVHRGDAVTAHQQ